MELMLGWLLLKEGGVGRGEKRERWEALDIPLPLLVLTLTHTHACIPHTHTHTHTHSMVLCSGS